MPVFELRVPAGRFNVEDKNALADACNQALVQGLGVPEGDRFVVISEHGPGELHLHPDFLDIRRDPTNAMIITVLIGAQRPFEDKQTLVATLNRLIVSAVGISPDDVVVALVPVPIENFSLGRGELQLADGPRW